MAETSIPARLVGALRSLVPRRFRADIPVVPVVLDLWPDRGTHPADLYTTIGNWRQEWRDRSWVVMVRTTSVGA